MRLLREYIRELLTEAAKGPADLPEGTFVQIRQSGGDVKISYVDKKGEHFIDNLTHREGRDPLIPYGEILIEKPNVEGAPGMNGGAFTGVDMEEENKKQEERNSKN